MLYLAFAEPGNASSSWHTDKTRAALCRHRSSPRCGCLATSNGHAANRAAGSGSRRECRGQLHGGAVRATRVRPEGTGGAEPPERTTAQAATEVARFGNGFGPRSPGPPESGQRVQQGSRIASAPEIKGGDRA